MYVVLPRVVPRSSPHHQRRYERAAALDASQVCMGAGQQGTSGVGGVVLLPTNVNPHLSGKPRKLFGFPQNATGNCGGE